MDIEGQRPRTRIGLDGFNLALEKGTGVATYGRNLSYALRELGAEIDVLYGRNVPPGPDLIREIGFFDPAPPISTESIPAALFQAACSLAPQRVVEIPVTGRVITRDFQSRLPAFDRLLNARNLFALAHNHFAVWGRLLRIRLARPPSLMHWTYPVPVELVGTKNIYTLHDLVPLRLPHTTLDHKRRYLSLMRTIARRADHIVTVSEASRTDIMSLLSVPAARVTNTYQAVDFHEGTVSEADARAAVAGAIGLPPEGYFLFFGAIEPKKNVDRLIQGFVAAAVETPLVLVGKMAWKSVQEMRLFELLRLRPERGGRGPSPGDPFSLLDPLGGGPHNRRLIHLDYAPQSLLISLIRCARGVVFPSLYEGFGLPVLEAMKLGTPVITSTAASLPEIAGEAALLVDPYDPAAIAEAIRRLDGDADLRARLAAEGLRQAARFSSEAYLGRLKSLYAGLGVVF